MAVEDAVGMALCHDITEIIPGSFKGCGFKKGHIVQAEDIPKLLDLGKRQLYVWEINEHNLHENEAALRIAGAVAGPGLAITPPKEGKVELKAATSGLLKVNVGALEEVNELEQIILASIHSNQLVAAGRTVAGCRVIPLVIDREKVAGAEKIGQAFFPVLEIKPLKVWNIGIVITGSEVYYGRIKDEFGPVLQKKITALGSRVLRQVFTDDNVDMIAGAIGTLIAEGAEMVLTTGGMSVDPDDVTPAGIRAAGGRVIVYGAPVLPGAMFMLAEIGSVPVLGLPGCVMYHKTTIFDLVFPRILAGERLARKDIVRLGHGGLCAGCDQCRYPDCTFGKGR